MKENNKSVKKLRWKICKCMNRNVFIEHVSGSKIV